MALLLVLPLGACAESPPITMDRSAGAGLAPSSTAVDSERLYVRFSPPGEPITLQGGQRTTRLLIDADADAQTGMRYESTGQALGVDLEIQISPAQADGSPGVGAAAWAWGSDHRKIRLSHSEIGFIFTPSYAARDFEARIDRALSPEVQRRLGSTVRTLGSTQRVRVRVAQMDRDGRELWASGVMEASAPPAGVRAPSGVIPSRAPGSVRVVSHNVLHASPGKDPGEFVRMYRALEPHVILVQEWDGYSGEMLAAWFNERVPIDGTWSAVAHQSERAGVAVVSRLPVREALTEPIEAPGGNWPVRFVGAVVESDAGPMLVGSMHLKCCGSAGSPEDERRVHETRAINAFVQRAMDERGIGMCVLGGDLNLVGSRPPLDVLRAGLDADGSDLETAGAVVVGDTWRHTWTDDRSLFTPGRLDWMVYSGSSQRETSAFVLETRGLSRGALSRTGLRQNDSRASDHLPVVADFVPRR